MKETRILMGMPVTIDLASTTSSELQQRAIDRAFAYFVHIDETFSTYKDTSEISAINAGTLPRDSWSPEMELIFTLSEETKQMTGGFFDIKTPKGIYDPSGIVKGWAIWNAAQLLQKEGFHDFYVDAGGDVQVFGRNADGDAWAIGIRNPWEVNEHIATVLAAKNEGVATSGTYIRGMHIYDPRSGDAADAIASLSVIGPNIYEADRFATAAFAMGTDAIHFIESLPGFEGYMIDTNKMATKTSGWERYTEPPPGT